MCERRPHKCAFSESEEVQRIWAYRPGDSSCIVKRFGTIVGAQRPFTILSPEPSDTGNDRHAPLVRMSETSSWRKVFRSNAELRSAVAYLRLKVLFAALHDPIHSWHAVGAPGDLSSFGVGGYSFARTRPYLRKRVSVPGALWTSRSRVSVRRAVAVNLVLLSGRERALLSLQREFVHPGKLVAGELQSKDVGAASVESTLSPESSSRPKMVTSLTGLAEIFMMSFRKAFVRAIYHAKADVKKAEGRRRKAESEGSGTCRRMSERD